MNEISQIDFCNIKFAYLKNDAIPSSSIERNEPWEPHLTTFILKLKFFYNIQNIIDVGANFGYISLIASKIIGDEGKIYSFEPQTQNYKLLEYNVKNNKIKNIQTFNYGCGNKICDITVPIFDLPLCNVNSGDITPNHTTANNFATVKCVKLDDMIFDKIDVIKIDVQGWEKMVLEGSENLLMKDKPFLIVEIEHFQLSKVNITCEELTSYIRSLNYYIYYLDYRYPSDHVCVHLDYLDDFNLKFKDCIFENNTLNDINYNIKYGIDKKIKLNYSIFM